MDGTIPPANPGDVDVAQALFGGMPTQVPAVYRDASPVAHVDPASAPFLVVHGVHDTVVPVAHARRLVAALQEAGVAVDYVEYPDAGHDVFAWERVGARTLSFPAATSNPTADPGWRDSTRDRSALGDRSRSRYEITRRVDSTRYPAGWH
jgi:acetyl esterase/lipase